MSIFSDISDIRSTLKARQRPTAVSWNRLEGRPQNDNFAAALRAEVRDPLWMLARQWQMGEFEGDDAGSPVFAKVHAATTKLRKYQPLDHEVLPFDDTKPLETQVECLPIPMQIAKQPICLDIRLMMGRHWFKMMGNAALQAGFITKYPIALPDRTKPEGAPIFAHPEVWQQWQAVAGRRMDGFAFYQYLKVAGNKASDGVAGAGAAEDAKGEAFVKWFEALFFQPAGEGDAWEPQRLEYQFSVAAPNAGGEKILRAEEYYQGHLDWYNLDHDKQAAQLGDAPIPPDEPGVTTEQTHTHTFIPAPVSFNGMPNTRWWAFEDGKTNFGELKPDRNDLGRLLVMEFALVYANDWFMLPFALEAGSLALVRGLAVTNVFGERTWVEPGSKGLDDDFKRWSMFTLNTKGKRGEPADLTLALLPTVPKIQEGKPFEEFAMLRDEMANMVWGVETRIPSPSGGSLNGREAAFETRRFFEELAGLTPQPPEEYKANIRYEVMNSVPENWIPFVPVHKEGSNSAIHLQRSSMLRFIEGDPNAPKIKPRTDLLREGLDQQPVKVFFIEEEEVPRSGIHVSQSFQRTRWYAGKVFTWLGVRKRTGRGEGSSGLAFDRVVANRKDVVSSTP
jgi:hypothetical protein